MTNKNMQERLMSNLDSGAKRDLFRELPSSEEAMAAILLTDIDGKKKLQGSEMIEADERIIKVKLSDIIDHPKQPYRVENNDEMVELVQSIKDSGILSPILLTDAYGDMDLGGKYLCVAGHRRRHAAALAGLTKIPAIIRTLSEEDADIMLVSTNSQREDTLPSEKAKAFKIRHDALKRKANKGFVGQLVQNEKGTNSLDIISDETGVNVKAIQRFLRLNELLPEWLAAVDNYAKGDKRDKEYPAIGMTTGVTLSYLKKHEQQYVWQVCDAQDMSLSLEMAEKLKGLAGCLTLDTVDGLFYAEKNKNKRDKPANTLRFFSKALMKKTDDFFPPDDMYQAPEIREATIIEALEMYWKAKGISIMKQQKAVGQVVQNEESE